MVRQPCLLPFSKAGTGLVVLSAPLSKVVQALSDGLTIGSGQWYNTLVHLKQI